MMSLIDCAELCLLDYDDVRAIAEHDHVPEVARTALANYLSAETAAPGAICSRMIGDIRQALDEGFVLHATQILMGLCHFLEENPQAAPGTTIH